MRVRPIRGCGLYAGAAYTRVRPIRRCGLYVGKYGIMNFCFLFLFWPTLVELSCSRICKKMTKILDNTWKPLTSATKALDKLSAREKGYRNDWKNVLVQKRYHIEHIATTCPIQQWHTVNILTAVYQDLHISSNFHAPFQCRTLGILCTKCKTDK